MYNTVPYKHKYPIIIMGYRVWELLDSNQRPSACKADALNQLS